MLADAQLVKEIVNSVADMRARPGYAGRRTWSDKCANPAQRKLTFRFWDKAEADKVAATLQATLAKHGYENEVQRASVRSSGNDSVGGEYVRVMARGQ